MSRTAMKLHENDVDVDRRLFGLGMNRRDILDIRDAAIREYAKGASPLFPFNGAGSLAYLYGTRELRSKFMNRGWKIDNSHGTSGVRNEEMNLIVLYQNVNVACNPNVLPQSFSPKGVGSERLTESNQSDFFNLLGNFALHTYTDNNLKNAVWYIMVAPHTGSVEVAHAVVKNGNFEELIERIFVSKKYDTSDYEEFGMPDVNTEEGNSDDDAIDFDIEISRR